MTLPRERPTLPPRSGRILRHASPSPQRRLLRRLARRLRRRGLRNKRELAWDADLRCSGSDLSFHSSRGAKWTDVKKPERRQYLKNAYRVSLTRARQRMVIFVPPGAKRDKIRSPGFYEGEPVPRRFWSTDRIDFSLFPPDSGQGDQHLFIGG